MDKGIPPPADEELLSLEIEIDPSLIEEALASVERAPEAGERPTGAPARNGAARVEAPGDDEALGEALEAERVERRAVEIRVAELEEELELLRDEQLRAGERTGELEHQLREMRQSLHNQGSDFERYRQRIRKDIEEAERRAEERALRALLEIFDNVERARFHSERDPSQILGGLQMIVEQFRRQLVRVGFERIPATRGTPFDPEVHEAVVHVDDEDVPEGAVVEEVSAGFKLRGRLFRPARVTVAARMVANDG